MGLLLATADLPQHVAPAGHLAGQGLGAAEQAAMDVQEQTIQVPLVVWRDSVAAGYDADAPHQWCLPTAPDATVLQVLRSIVTAKYLAQIAGGKATWIAQTDRDPLGVVAQQWNESRLLAPPETLIWDAVNRSARPNLQMRYWCQVDPDQVFACLRAGRPLPNRYTGL